MNIGCRVAVPLVMGTAAWTGPQPITQGDGMVEETTAMTPFGGGEKAVNMVHMRAMLFCRLVHNLHKTPKAQIRHLVVPQCLHTT